MPILFNVILFLLLVVFVWPSRGATATQEFNVLSYVSMTIGGRPISNSDVLAAYATEVIAIKHFNERNSSILPVLSELGQCNASLNLVRGLFDDEVLSSVAMSHLIQTLATTKVDFIKSPLATDVGFN